MKIVILNYLNKVGSIFREGRRIWLEQIKYSRSMKNTGTKKVSWNMSHRYLRKCQKFIDVFFQCRVAKKSGLSCERRGYVYVSFYGTREVTKPLMIMLPL